MSLSRWQRSIVTESGDTIAEAEIEVFDAGESSKPDLFQDSDGSTALTNPFNADGSGFAAFYVAGGRYDIAVNGAVIWTNVALGTVQSRDVGTGADQVPDISALESALGIDTSGPAGDDVLAAVGRGAIVESDTNDNGSYVRWENGEQVCWRRASEPHPNGVEEGGLFVSDNVTHDMPATFDVLASGGVYYRSSRASNGFWMSGEARASLWRTTALRTQSFDDGDVGEFALFAWGFWK